MLLYFPIRGRGHFGKRGWARRWAHGSPSFPAPSLHLRLSTVLFIFDSLALSSLVRALVRRVRTVSYQEDAKSKGSDMHDMAPLVSSCS